jgi:hypothetical protein
MISVFMDNELDSELAAQMRSHLAICLDCARVCEDFASILDVCGAETAPEVVPPNSRALWCRINNIIENEAPQGTQEMPARTARRVWRLSFSQLAAAVLCVAVVSSLLTIAALRNYTQPAAVDLTSRSAASQTTFEKVLVRVGLAESPHQARERRLNEQRAAIDYWNARVQARRVQWDRTTRDAFDRNLQVIDESVSEYTMILQRDPEDDLSGEMLDSVLSEKMNLLRDFSEL